MAKQVTGEVMIGQKPRLADPEVMKRLIRAIEQNMPHEAAAQYAGVSIRAFYNWMAFGRAAEAKRLQGETLNENEDLYVHFMHAAKEAESKAIYRNLAIIQHAAKKQWQAAAWIIERKYPQWFALHRTLEVSGPGGGPIEVSPVDLSKLSTEELNVMRGLMQKAGGKALGYNGANGNGRNGNQPEGEP